MVSRAIAEELGLPPGLMLVTGGHDQTCAALGAGAIREGLGVVSTGTAEVLSTALDQPVLSEAMFNNFYPCYLHVKKGMFFTFSAHNAIDVYQLIDGRMPAGPSPVMFLPHLNGSGTPTCDLRSKGAVVGLTLATTRHDVAKAILEGLAFELQNNLQAMLSCGLRIDELVAVGGGAKSSSWLQLKADILQRPLRTLRCRESACLGAALLAGTAAGLYNHLDEAVAETIQYDREFVPLPDRVAAYSDRYAVYKQLYPALCTLNSKL